MKACTTVEEAVSYIIERFNAGENEVEVLLIDVSSDRVSREIARLRGMKGGPSYSPGWLSEPSSFYKPLGWEEN